MISLLRCLAAADDFWLDVDVDDLLHEFEAPEREGISHETLLLDNDEDASADVVVFVAVVGGGMTGMLVEAAVVGVGGSVTEVGGFEMLTTELFSFCSSGSDTAAGLLVLNVDVAGVVVVRRLKDGTPTVSHFHRPSRWVSLEKS